MKIVVSSLALEDQIREARFWKKQDPTLPAEFFDELDAANKEIEKAPEANSYLNKEWNIRRHLERRFHTWIVYRHVGNLDELQILRIYNARMKPEDFLDSLDNF